MTEFESYPNKEGVFVIEIQEYVQSLMPKFEEVYKETEGMVEENHQHKNAFIYYRFENDKGEQIEEGKALFAYFINGANNHFSEKIIEDNRRYWKGLPFSMLSEDLKRRYFSINELNKSDAQINIETIENRPCNGIYLKWIAPDTNYYYWLFPYVEEKAKTKEIGTKRRWFIEEENQTSNEDGRGLTREETMKIKDSVSRKYWNMLDTIYSSPEVYFLETLETKQEYELSYWEKIIVNGSSYKHKSFDRMQDYEIEFKRRTQYTQTD